MPLFQRHPDGALSRRTILSDGTGDGFLGSSPDGTADCCCEIPPQPQWHSIIPCSDALPADPEGTVCCDGDGSTCGWIDETTFCRIIQDAIDAGDLDPACAQSTPQCGLTWNGSRDSSACDLATPDYLVLYNNLTQSCWRLYLRDPDGTGTAFGRVCRTTGVTDPDTPPSGTDYSDYAVYVGTDCCDSPCPCTDSVPDPPTDPTPDPTIDPDATDCCGDPTDQFYELVVAGMVSGVCFTNVGSDWKFSGLEGLNRSFRIDPVGTSTCQSLSFPAAMTSKQYSSSDGSCTGLISSIPISLTVSAVYNDGACPGQWRAGIVNANPIFTPFFKVCVGDCTGGTAANVFSAVGGTVTIQKRDPLP